MRLNLNIISRHCTTDQLAILDHAEREALIAVDELPRYVAADRPRVKAWARRRLARVAQCRRVLFGN